MLRVVAIHDLVELDRYYLAWKRLLAAQAEVSFAQSIAYWRALAELGEVCILAVERNGELLGIAPFYRARGTQVTATLWTGGPWQAALGWRVVGTNSTLVMLSAWRWWREQSNALGNLELAGIDSEGERARLVSTLELVGDAPRIVEQTRSVIRLETLATQTARAEIERSRWLRYRPEGNAYGDGEACEYLLDACRTIAPQSFTARSIPPEVHAAAVASGALDLAVLLQDDTPLAFWYAIQSSGRLTVLAQGDTFASNDTLQAEAWRQWLVESRKLGEREVRFDPREIAMSELVKSKVKIDSLPSWSIAVNHSPRGFLSRFWPFHRSSTSAESASGAAR